MISKRKSLASIVGASAAAGLLSLVPVFEGTKLTTYRDIAGVLTYCTGATEDAHWGKVYTVEECRAQLDSDLVRHAEGVMACIHVPLTDGQKTAFIDAAYNIGISAFCGSSMAKRANVGDMHGACESLLLWNKVNGRTVAGLTHRRETERDICEGKVIATKSKG